MKKGTNSSDIPLVVNTKTKQMKKNYLNEFLKY